MALILDCSVQQANKPAVAFGSASEFWSGKHKMYCFKREYGHLPNGIVAFMSNVFPGKVHDYTVCMSMIPAYKRFLRKDEDELNLADDNPEERRWAALADKAYIGLEHHIRAIIPKKGNITEEEEKRNKTIGKAPVIAENFYGRKVRQFVMAADRFTRSMDQFKKYDDIMTALTNYAIFKKPLRKTEHHVYGNHLEEIRKEYERKQEIRRLQNKARLDRHREALTKGNDSFGSRERFPDGRQISTSSSSEDEVDEIANGFSSLMNFLR